MESTEMTLAPMASESIKRLLLIDSVGSALAFSRIPSWYISFTEKLVSESLAMPTFVALQCSKADPTAPPFGGTAFEIRCRLSGDRPMCPERCAAQRD